MREKPAVRRRRPRLRYFAGQTSGNVREDSPPPRVSRFRLRKRPLMAITALDLRAEYTQSRKLGSTRCNQLLRSCPQLAHQIGRPDKTFTIRKWMLQLTIGVDADPHAAAASGSRQRRRGKTIERTGPPANDAHRASNSGRLLIDGRRAL